MVAPAAEISKDVSSICRQNQPPAVSKTAGGSLINEQRELDRMRSAFFSLHDVPLYSRFQPYTEHQVFTECFFVICSRQTVCMLAAYNRIYLRNAQTLKNQACCFLGTLCVAAAAMCKQYSTAPDMQRELFMPEDQGRAVYLKPACDLQQTG